MQDKKVLLDYIANKEIKAYVDSLYEILQKSSGNISRNEMMTICRLVNIENILFNIR